jgi:hypothetical protein
VPIINDRRPVFINEQGDNDHTYLSLFKGKTIVVFAPSLYSAKCRAMDYFKPAKKDAGLVAIELHSLNTEPANFIPNEVSHAAS